MVHVITAMKKLNPHCTSDNFQPVADMIGVSATLWIGAAWIVVTTAAVLCVPSVRDFRGRAVVSASPVTV